MKKSGFTLIELLAVIVILGVIAGIIVPVVTDVISDSEIEIAQRSAENYVKTVNQVIMRKLANSPVSDGEYDVIEGGNICLTSKSSATACSDNNVLEVKIEGGTVTSGKIKITDNAVSDYSLQIGDYVANYDVSNEKILIEEGSTIEL